MKQTRNPIHVDLSMLKKDTLGNTEVMSKLIVLFLKSIDEFTSNLKIFWPSNEYDTLYSAAHKIKPIIPMFGVTSLSNELIEFEALLKNNGDKERINAIVEKCFIVLAQVKLELENELTPEPHEKH